MKTLNPKFAIVLISILAMLVSPAATSSASGSSNVVRNDPPPPIEITLSDGPATEDENWPVIKNKTRERKDPSTGQETIETIVIRQEPPSKDKNACKEKHNNKINQDITIAATCVINRYSVTIQVSSPGPGGGVTAYAKNIADEYCESGICDFYKMKKLQIWWTRISTSWGVRSAMTYWGCNGACTLCGTNGTNTTRYHWQSAYFNPTWNGLTSSVYTYTSSSMPIMATNAPAGYVTGRNTSVVVLPNNQTQSLTVEAIFWN